jgi:hypothetical protein
MKVQIAVATDLAARASETPSETAIQDCESKRTREKPRLVKIKPTPRNIAMMAALRCRQSSLTDDRFYAQTPIEHGID